MAARVVILLAFLVGTSEGLVLILVRNVWGHAYSKDHEVVAYLTKMMLILAPSVLFDGLQYVLSGTHIFTMHIDSINWSQQFRLWLQVQVWSFISHASPISCRHFAVREILHVA
jgi:Na+-driven multidrug efflux pump